MTRFRTAFLVYVHFCLYAAQVRLRNLLDSFHRLAILAMHISPIIPQYRERLPEFFVRYRAPLKSVNAVVELVLTHGEPSGDDSDQRNHGACTPA